VREAVAGIDFVRDVLQTSGPEGLLEYLPRWMTEPIRGALAKVSSSTQELASFVARRAPATAAALFLAIWALAVVGLIDNVVKPLLIKGGVQINAAVLFFALIGGLAMFGAVGLIVGPLAVSLFVAVATAPEPTAESALEPAQEKPAETAPH